MLYIDRCPLLVPFPTMESNTRIMAHPSPFTTLLFRCRNQPRQGQAKIQKTRLLFPLVSAIARYFPTIHPLPPNIHLTAIWPKTTWFGDMSGIFLDTPLYHPISLDIENVSIDPYNTLYLYIFLCIELSVSSWRATPSKIIHFADWDFPIKLKNHLFWGNPK